MKCQAHSTRISVSVLLLQHRGGHITASDSMSDNQTEAGNDLSRSVCAPRCVGARSAESHGESHGKLLQIWTIC